MRLSIQTFQKLVFHDAPLFECDYRYKLSKTSFSLRIVLVCTQEQSKIVTYVNAIHYKVLQKLVTCR